MTFRSVAIMLAGLAIPVFVAGCSGGGTAASREGLAAVVKADGVADVSAVSTATPVPPAALYPLYANRTWLWQFGAGYFSAGDQRFLAWSRTDGNGSYAEGHWYLTPEGRMCMEATWHNRAGSARDRTCFDHVRVGNAIYQRKSPAGNWYLFKGPGRTPGEYAKFRRGDQVSKPYAQTRAQEMERRRAGR